DDPEQSRRAVEVLGRMGPVAEKAIPTILRVAQKQTPPDDVYLESLARMGEPVIARVFEAVEKESPDALTGDHWSVRCLKSVGGVGIPKLTEALKNSNLSVRIAAARSLGEMGANADRAETRLMELLNDPDPRARAVALGSLVGVKASPDIVVPRVKAAIEDESTAVRLTGLQLVPALGEAGKALVPSVMAALKDGDDTVRRAALNALDANSAEAVPTLIEQLDDSTLRPAVLDALIRIGSPSSGAVQKLVALLPKASKSQRLQIFGLLAKLGPGAAAARPEISGSLNDKDAELRAAATSAFASLEGEAALPVMISALDDSDPKVRQAAAVALGKLGEKAREAAPKLTALLRQESDRGPALEALERLSVDSIPDLLEMLKIADPDVKVFACERLRRVGRGKEEVIAPLEAAMRDDNSNVRRAARRAIERLKQK
ncbi:MAG: HEAT repeat domain-containing protein, partial [Chthoniobacteraceae bacterium]